MQGPETATVIFILGGPGSGKGTISQKINHHFKFHHLSAGDLLRAERNTKGSQFGQIIEKNIVEGKIVPSHITVSLLQNAMKKEGLQGGRFLIDGFPRNLQNLQAWKNGMNKKVNIPFIIHLQCGQAIMEQRLLKRGQTSGRSDDNIQSIKKRFKTYEQQTKLIVDYYTNLGKNVNINSENTPDQVFEQVTVLFKKHNLA